MRMDSGLPQCEACAEERLQAAMQGAALIVASPSLVMELGWVDIPWYNRIYPLVIYNIAMENASFIEGFMMIYLSKMVIFHSYVKKPNSIVFLSYEQCSKTRLLDDEYRGLYMINQL